MSTLDSTSTRDDVIAAYADNASYTEDASSAKAKAFITACRLLLSPAMSAKRAKGGNSQEIELDLGLIRSELESAVAWSSSRDESTTATSVSHLDISNLRG